MDRFLREVARAFPFLLGWRIKLIVAHRRLTYPLRYLPFKSRTFGPPKGEYLSLRHYARDPISQGYLEIRELSKKTYGHRNPPITNSARVKRAFLERETYKVFGASVGVVRGGRVWGFDGGSVITPNDRLIWNLSPVNYTFKRDLHHVFTKFRLPPVKQYGKVVNLVTRCAEDNYWHWMFDLLPRVELVERAGISLDDAYYLVNHRGHSFQLDSLAHLGIPKDRVILATKDVHVEAEELILPSVVNPNLNTDGLSYSKEAFEFLRNRFLGKNIPRTRNRPRLFISRDRSRRRIRNEASLYKRLQRYGFERIYLEDRSLVEQARLFNSAEWIIGLHGAGLSNIVFCRPGTRITEVFAPDFIATNFWTLSEQLGFQYHCYCEDSRYLGVQGGRFQRNLDLSVSVPEFMNFFKRVQHAAPITTGTPEVERPSGILETDLTQPLI